MKKNSESKQHGVYSIVSLVDDQPMIKLFRKIRQNLLSAGKTGKYLKYAFGEILLVVIGILIALQINNWNENRLKKNDASNYLLQIRAELFLDIEHYQRDSTTIKVTTEYLNHVSDGNYEEVDLAQLQVYLTRNLDDKNFGISYKKLLESGAVEYVEGVQLREQLQAYYFKYCADYNNVAAYHSKFISENIEGPLLQILQHSRNFEVNPQEVIEQLEHGALRSLINWQTSFIEKFSPAVDEHVNLAEGLIKMINENTITNR
jgi:hypothetical protein